MNDTGEHNRPSVSIETQLTFEEYQEALTLIQVEVSRREVAARGSGAKVIPWAVYTAVAIAMSTVAARFDPLAGSRPTFYAMVALVIPLAVSTIAALVLSAYIRRNALSDSPGRRLRRWLVIALPWLVVVFFLYSELHQAQPAWRRQLGLPPIEPDWFGLLFPHTMWIAVTVVRVWVSIRFGAMTVAARRVWDGSPQLQRPMRAELVPAGVRVQTADVARDYHWSAFVRFVETKHLLLLCPSDMSFEMLPKRAFADAATLDRARQMCQAHIQPREQRPLAFPVAIAAAPLPVQPIDGPAPAPSAEASKP